MSRSSSYHAEASLVDYKPLSMDMSETKFKEKLDLVSNRKELVDLITDLDREASEIEKNLWKYSALESKKHQAELSNIDFQRSSLTDAVSASRDLTSLYTNANDLGNTLTYKIKSLDREIFNVSSTLEFVKDIQLLKNNVNQASYAIERKDWSLAAQCIHTINTDLTPELVSGKFASVVVPSTDIPDSPKTAIENWTTQLAEQFKLEFETASKKRDLAELTKYFQLFPLINREEFGLNCYSKFIRSVISETSKMLINSATGNVKPGSYSDISMKLFENISVMLSQHERFIVGSYSSTYKNAMHYVVTKVQHEVDSQVGLITDTFYDTCDIGNLLARIDIDEANNKNGVHQAMNQEDAGAPAGQEAEPISIIEVGDIIGELSSILHNWTLYCKFITCKYFPSNYDVNNSILTTPILFQESTFYEKIHKTLLPAFTKLTVYYLKNSLKKAISIEELPSLDEYLKNGDSLQFPEPAPCSSVIEDSTLVLNNMLQNILKTADIPTIKKLVTVAFSIVNDTIINDFLISNINKNIPRYNSGLYFVMQSSSDSPAMTSPSASRSNTPVPEGGSSTMGFFKGASSAFGNVVGSSNINNVSNLAIPAGSQNPKITSTILYLNTVAVGQEYFSRMRESFRKDNFEALQDLIPFNKNFENAASLIDSCFVDPFIAVSNRIVQETIVNLYNLCIKSKLINMINEYFPEYSESNYLIYSASVLDDNSQTIKFVSSWSALISPYKQCMHKNNSFSKFLRLIVVNLVNLLEKKLWSILKNFKINELGCLKLDKDMSNLISEVCGDNYVLREKFLKVTQMIMLIGMEDDEYDLSVSARHLDSASEDDQQGINWILTPSERQQAREARV